MVLYMAVGDGDDNTVMMVMMMMKMIVITMVLIMTRTDFQVTGSDPGLSLVHGCRRW